MRKREKRERKERDFRERSSTFSLDFPVIGSANSGEARSKVAPHGKGYAWVPVLGEFRRTPKGRFSPIFIIIWLRAILMDVELLRPGWPWFRFQKIWTDRRNP